MTRQVVVVGHGMVGARLVEEIRRRDPRGEAVALTVVGAEARPAYNRVLLSTVLAGGLPSAVDLLPERWAQDWGVDARLGVSATAIGDGVLRTTDGDVPFDDLVLATGSRPRLPPVPGIEQGIPFRDLDDCERIVERARPGVRFAVLGGGLLGCEAARGLAERDVKVTLVHHRPHLMERQLDPFGGEVLAAALERLGVDVRLDTVAAEWDGGLHLADGSVLAADELVVATGVRPETGLAEAAGIIVDQGIIVDDRLATSRPRVHAIGDCAQHRGAVPGFVQPGWEQAAVLADLLTGADPAARYTGTRPVTRLKARGVDLAAVGAPAALAGADVLRFVDPAGGRYAALAMEGDRVVGGAVIGMPETAATMVQYFDTGAPAPSDRLGLLLGRLPATTVDPGRLPGAAIVCRCTTVTKSALVTAWRAGATSVAALRRATRAGTGCGSCTDTVCGLADWLATADPDPIAEGAA
ncbi:FAD-dependent oxidoreductase [Pseudonocardia thermophila]|uniref:FAD-dependent oxidoreductase n=1 Tax=Pseudonocardia thermophila TaxID=1848 RepID=UPI00248E3B44|nr:FAD-dependent oxidoreductase [Pseudonocardia thermophila]